MTLQDALRQFGLAKLPPKHVLKILRDAAAKAAHARNDTLELSAINAAWAILTGKTDAAAVDAAGAAEQGPSGMIEAHCSLYKTQTFILDWTMYPRAGKSGGDTIRLHSPQTVSWNDSLGCFQLVSATGGRKSYPVGGIATGSSPTPFSDGWSSGFLAELSFDKTAVCPHCAANHLQWCQHCHGIFCHFGKDHYANGSYACPHCAAGYTWNGTGSAPIKTVFDGKQLRALCDLAPNQALDTASPKQITHR